MLFFLLYILNQSRENSTAARHLQTVSYTRQSDNNDIICIILLLLLLLRIYNMYI